ncbi:MAG: hypothetical protein M1834_003256 [Cirrosporium novae-zelandiae]|nr:MAG: hypothetical protein M1834_003256 [Cirrosporium novae-zelandiae]
MAFQSSTSRVGLCGRRICLQVKGTKARRPLISNPFLSNSSQSVLLGSYISRGFHDDGSTQELHNTKSLAPTYESAFQDHVFAVTGGSSGIGLVTAKLLVSYGAKVSITGRTPSKLAAAEAEITEIGGPEAILATTVDVENSKDVNSWIEATIKRFGKLNGAVNASAYPPPQMVPLTALDNETWDTVIARNLTGVMNSMRAELRDLRSGGAIVNVSSIVSHIGAPRNEAYTAVKHGIIGLTRAAAKEYGPGIRINAVSP